MRQAIYVPVFEVRPGGLGTYIREIVSRLISYSTSTVLFTTTPETVPSSWDVEVIAPPSGIRLLPGPGRVASRMFWLNAIIPGDLKRCSADVVFSPLHEAMIRSPVPQTMVIHDLTMLVLPSSYFNPLLRKYMQYVLPTVARSCTRVVAVSENTRKDVLAHCGIDQSRVTVVGEGYDAGSFFVRTEEERTKVLARLNLGRPYLLYSGTFAPHKNVEFLAEVLRVLGTRGVEIDLVLTGPTGEKDFESTKARFIERGVWARVRCLGYVTAPDLSALMSSAAAFVFPSRYEGFGLAPLEALASGAVVLSSDKASLPEILGDSGWLLSIDDPDKWASKIQEVLSLSDSEREIIRRRAVRQASRFSWDDSAERLFNLITQSALRV